MNFAALGRTALTLLIGGLGAAVAWSTGFPAPFLTGPALAVTIASLGGLKLDVANWFRNGMFVVLGTTIGQTVTPDVLSAAIRWPLSFACLFAMLLVIIAACRAFLMRRWGFDRTTALMGAFPGHLSYVLGLSEGIRADIPTVSVIQSVRVLALTLSVPVIIAVFGDLPEVAPQAAAILDVRLLVAILALAGAVGWLFKLAKFPAAFLLGAMAVSAILHGAEIVTAAVPPWMTIAAFIALGSMIGTRFSGTTFAELKRSMAAGVFVTIASVAIAALFALLAAYLTGFPVPSVLIAFAPGGLETMVAMSVLLGSDPTFVAAHHVARLLMLTMIIPLFLIRGKRN